jgi:hypothetical protein
MLVEIFFLRMEAALRANDNETRHDTKFVPFDPTAPSNFKESRRIAPPGPSTIH